VAAALDDFLYVAIDHGKRAGQYRRAASERDPLGTLVAGAAP